MTRPLRLLTIIGARPQIIKAAALGRAIKGPFLGRIQEILLHTGQHYDQDMSAVFFNELGIAPPDIQLGVGSASHGEQTARMLEGIEKALQKERPDVLVIYGDTNSTLAGAIAASKMHVPVAHIEAGLRSYNKRMPEEINRIVSDHCSTWLFCPTTTAVGNLEQEGFDTGINVKAGMDTPRVVLSGDVMYDNSIHFSRLAGQRSSILDRLGLEEDRFLLATLHRPANTDDPGRAQAILGALTGLRKEYGMPLVIPLHPRTCARLQEDLPALLRELETARDVHLLPPAGFLDMTRLEQAARLVITDSGGVQKEAYFFGKPCIILRAETEWVELVEHGMAILADADPEKIAAAAAHFMSGESEVTDGIFGDGNAAEHICAELLSQHPA